MKQIQGMIDALVVRDAVHDDGIVRRESAIVLVVLVLPVADAPA